MRPEVRERRAAYHRRRRQSVALRMMLRAERVPSERAAYGAETVAWSIGHHAGRLFALREQAHDARWWTAEELAAARGPGEFDWAFSVPR